MGEKVDEYHMHEVLYMSAFLARCVYEELVLHSAINEDIKLLELATEAQVALEKLYQVIGAKHL